MATTERAGAMKAQQVVDLNNTRRAVADGCSLVVFPEMAVTGYPLEDLVLSTDVQHSAELHSQPAAVTAPGNGQSAGQSLLGGA